MKSLTQQVAAIVSLSSFLAAPAFAGPGNGNHYGNGGNGNHYGWSYSSYYVRSLNFALVSVNARVLRDELTVRFRADEQSLRFAQRSGITPVLRVEIAGQVFTAPITQCDGVVTFSLPRRVEPREMVVSVSGANGRFRIDTVSLGGAVANRVTVPVERVRDDRPQHGGGYGNHPQPQPMRWSFQPAVIAACGNALEGQYNEMECLRIVDGFAFNPVDTINTCELVMEGDANELACLQTAQRSATPRIPALNSCELAMEGDANELACFAKAVTYRFEAKSTIDACELAFDGDSNELACMDSAFRYSFNPVPVIQSCEAAMDGDAAELACLARY